MALLFIGCTAIGWLESVGLAMTGICVDNQDEIGTAVGVAGSIRSGISTIASTIYTVILTNRLSTTIPAVVPPALVDAGLPAASVPNFLAAITLGTPDAFAAVQGLTEQEANIQAYRTVLLTIIAFSGTGIICSFGAPNVDKLVTNKVTATLLKSEVEKGEGTLSKA